MRWYEIVIKIIVVAASFVSVASFLVWSYYMWIEYSSIQKELAFKQNLFRMHCSIYEEYKNDVGVVNQCKQWSADIIMLSKTFQKAFSNVGEAYRMCGNTDCMEYFSKMFVFVAGITSDVAWFVVSLAFIIVVMILMLAIAVFLCFGHINYKQKLYENTYGGMGNLPLRQQYTRQEGIKITEVPEIDYNPKTKIPIAIEWAKKDA